MLDSCGYGSDSQREADQQSMQNSTMRRAASRPYTGQRITRSPQLHAPCLICALWQPRWPIRTLSACTIPYTSEVASLPQPHHVYGPQPEGILKSPGFFRGKFSRVESYSGYWVMSSRTQYDFISVLGGAESGTQGDDCNRAAEDLCGSDCAEQAPKHVPQPASRKS